MNAAAEAERKYILVVDDEEDVRNYLSAILEDSGYEVAKAEDGGKALEMVKQRAPDLISLDLVMPGRSGAKFLYALRKDRKLSKIPVIIVTGHAHDELGKGDLADIFAGKAIHGPAHCLEKPVTPAGYVSAIRRQLGLTAESKPTPLAKPGTEMRDRIGSKLDRADPETMKKVLELLDAQDANDATAETGRPRVLIIDDEPDVSAYLSALLSDQGYRTECSNDPDQGLSLAKANPPDLITLDVDMPTKSGVALFREIRAIEELKDVPIVVITGVQKDMKPAFHGRGPGADIAGYVTKPFQPSVLFETVEDALKGSTAGEA